MALHSHYMAESQTLCPWAGGRPPPTLWLPDKTLRHSDFELFMSRQQHAYCITFFLMSERKWWSKKLDLKTIDSWKNGVFCPWHFARKFSWEVCGFREWETIKLIATINLLPQNIKFPCHYTFIPHLAPGSKLFSESLKSINQFMNLYVWVEYIVNWKT